MPGNIFQIGAITSFFRICALATMLATSTTTWADNAPEEPDYDVEINLEQSVTPEELRQMWEQIAAFEQKIRDASTEVALRAQVGASPLLRQIVCRIPDQPFEVSMLAKALGLPEHTVFDGVQLLERMGLTAVQKKNNGRIVVPRSPLAQTIMRKWADEWCVGDDSCGVQR